MPIDSSNADRQISGWPLFYRHSQSSVAWPPPPSAMERRFEDSSQDCNEAKEFQLRADESTAPSTPVSTVTAQCGWPGVGQGFFLQAGQGRG